jgi:hypothetical protein
MHLRIDQCSHLERTPPPPHWSFSPWIMCIPILSESFALKCRFFGLSLTWIGKEKWKFQCWALCMKYESQNLYPKASAWAGLFRRKLLGNLDIVWTISFINPAPALTYFSTHGIPRHISPIGEYTLPNILQTSLNIVECHVQRMKHNRVTKSHHNKIEQLSL